MAGLGHMGLGAHLLAAEIRGGSEGTDGGKGAGGRQWPGGGHGAPAGLVAPLAVPGKGALPLVLLPRARDPHRVSPRSPHLPGSCCAPRLVPPALAGRGWRCRLALRTVTKCLGTRREGRGGQRSPVRVRREGGSHRGTARYSRPRGHGQGSVAGDALHWVKVVPATRGAAECPDSTQPPRKVPRVARTPWDNEDQDGMDRAGGAGTAQIGGRKDGVEGDGMGQGGIG